MRTTSSLEANNAQLNSTVVNHGNFYTFIHDLRLQEFLSTMRFERYCLSGGKAKPPRAEFQVVFFLFLCIYSFYRSYRCFSVLSF